MKVIMGSDVYFPGINGVSTSIETIIGEFASDAREFANEWSSQERALQLATV